MGKMIRKSYLKVWIKSDLDLCKCSHGCTNLSTHLSVMHTHVHMRVCIYALSLSPSSRSICPPVSLLCALACTHPSLLLSRSRALTFSLLLSLRKRLFRPINCALRSITKCLTFYQTNPTFYQTSANMNSKSPMFYQKSSILYQNNPTFINRDVYFIDFSIRAYMERGNKECEEVAHTNIHTHTHMHTHTHTHIHTYTHTHIHERTHAHAHTRSHAHTHSGATRSVKKSWR